MFSSELNPIRGTNIFISDQWGASNVNLLKTHDIKYVLNVTPVPMPMYELL